jgi:hypothetical protein
MRQAFLLQFLLALLLALPGLAAAQASRTWVSGVGDDANPCSRTAPCKTFAGAISKTAAGGVISVLDPGGYGAVTITKSITIETDGQLAGTLAAGTNGIIVNAAAGDVVTLRGIRLHGFGTGLNGVRFLAGKALVMEDVTIESFGENGVLFAPSAASTLTMRRVLVRSAPNVAVNNHAGIAIRPTGTGSASFLIDDVTVSDAAAFGIDVGPGADGTIRDSEVHSSGKSGVIVAIPPAGTTVASVLLDGVHIVDSAENGILVDGAFARARLSECVVRGNATGLAALNSGQIVSYGNNRVAENVTNGTPTSVVASQ